MRLPDKSREGLWRFINISASISLAALAVSAAVAHGWVRFGLAVGAIAVTVIQQVAQWRRDRADEGITENAEQLAEDVLTTTHAALSGAFVPLLRVLAQIEEAENEARRSRLRAAAIASVVHAAPAVLGPDRTRACYFALEYEPGGLARLRFHSSAGREDEPRTRFDPQTPSGEAAMKMVVEDGHTFCEDTELSPPPGWEDHPHQYRTFISVPVRGDQIIVGMLTVDAPSPGDLSIRRDLPILLVLARILAVSQISQSE